MSRKLKPHWYLLLLLSCLVASGCDTVSSTPEANGRQLDINSQQESQTQNEVTKDTDDEPTSSDPNSESASEGTIDEPQAYQPPFPDRVDLFLPPKRGPKALALDRKDGESAVQLLGFSNVNDARVVLSIDGYVYPVAEGESKLGIEVVSIKPPAVVLQRGRQVWQASLEN